MSTSIHPALRRNIALIGHLHVGKTALAEALLFQAGAIPRVGRTADGSSHFDFENEEIKHRSTLKDCAYDFNHGKCSVTILDTPGSFDFVADIYCALRAADMALLVIGASSGVKVQGEKAWKLAGKEALPRAIFVGEIDVPEASIESALLTAARALDVSPLPVTMPLPGQPLQIANILTGTLYETKPGGKTTSRPMTEAEAAQLAEHRSKLSETVAETDDALLERYLENGELAQEELAAGVRSALARGAITPVFCGSPETHAGVLALLDCCETLFPSPLERAPFAAIAETAAEPGSELAEVPLATDPDAPFVGLVFKTLSDPFTGQISLVRVVRGTLHSDDTVLNSRTGQQERVGKLHLQHGKEFDTIEAAVAGQVVGIAKLKNTHTGDTLSTLQDPVVLRGLSFPKPNMTFAIRPKSRKDEDKIYQAIVNITEEDPAISVHRDSSTHETLMAGFSQHHIEITLERIQRKFHVEGVLQAPKVPYRETIKQSAEAQGRHKKQTGGHGQFGDCWLRLSPRGRGEGFLFSNEIFGGAIPKNYIPAVEKGAVEALQQGFLAGFPIVDVEVAVYDGSYHPVDSSELSFKLAAIKAVKAALEKARPVLLEPIMLATIEAPEECTGAVLGDLNARRGRVLNIDTKGSQAFISAHTPLTEMLSYISTLRSLTADRGSFELEFQGYEEVPAVIAQRIIAEKRTGNGTENVQHAG